MADEFVRTDALPEGWTVQRVGDFAVVKGGKRLPTGTALTDKRTNHPYLRIVDFRDGRVDRSSLQFVPDDVYPRISRYTISASDIWISIVGTVGLVGLVDKDLDGANLTENAAKICSIASHVDKTFLSLFLRSQHGVEQIRAQTVGSTQPKLALFRIADIRVPLPPLLEQRAVAHILSTLDDKIELNRKQNETLEAMARALFKDWFVDFGPVRAKMEGRAPYLPAEIWDLFPDQLDEEGKPEGWRCSTLATLARLNPESWTKTNAPHEIRYVDLSNTKLGTIEGINQMPWSEAPSRAQRILRPGDTIVGTVRPGNKSFALIGDDGMTGSTGFAVLRPQDKDFRDLVFLAATSPENIERLTHLADGAAYPAVRPDVVLASPITIPPGEVANDVLHGFANTVSGWFDAIKRNKQESHTVAQLRDTLLPKLISGELRIKDAEKFVERVA